MDPEFLLIFVVPIILGIVIRVLVQKKPRLQFPLWSTLLLTWIIFLIYGIILAFNKNGSMALSDQSSNVSLIISSVIFIMLGINYFVKNKKAIFRK